MSDRVLCFQNASKYTTVLIICKNNIFTALTSEAWQHFNIYGSPRTHCDFLKKLKAEMHCYALSFLFFFFRETLDVRICAVMVTPETDYYRLLVLLQLLRIMVVWNYAFDSQNKWGKILPRFIKTLIEYRQTCPILDLWR